MSLWWGICIVSIIILMITMALVAMYASDVFDFASESYNDTAIPALFMIALVSAFGVYVSVDKLSKPSNLSKQGFLLVPQPKNSPLEKFQNVDTSQAQLPPPFKETPKQEVTEQGYVALPPPPLETPPIQ